MAPTGQQLAALDNCSGLDSSLTLELQSDLPRSWAGAELLWSLELRAKPVRRRCFRVYSSQSPFKKGDTGGFGSESGLCPSRLERMGLSDSASPRAIWGQDPAISSKGGVGIPSCQVGSRNSSRFQLGSKK